MNFDTPIAKSEGFLVHGEMPLQKQCLYSVLFARTKQQRYALPPKFVNLHL